MAIQPLDKISINPLIASLPKADLHLHQEEVARLERVLARQQKRPPHNWRASAKQLISKIPPGEKRLAEMYKPDDTLDLADVQADAPEYIVAKIANALEESAADGSILVEIRFGTGGLAFRQAEFMTLFRQAETQVKERYPRLCAEAIGFLFLSNNEERLRIAEQHLERCLQVSDEGLAGLDFRLSPYSTEADPSLWTTAYKMAEHATDAGLGITIHAGEFSAANIEAALRMPSIRRLGHGVYAASNSQLLEQLASRNITVEFSLSSNVILGAVASYADHPIHQFVKAGIPVTLNTDDPIRIWTTIGREYAIAARLGFSTADLFGFTRNAIQSSFTSDERRKILMNEINEWKPL